MVLWAEEIIRNINRHTIPLLFSEHSANDKNLTQEDVDNVVVTVRVGKIDEEMSTQNTQRICFKNYFDNYGKTYFVITESRDEYCKIITVIKKKGKY